MPAPGQKRFTMTELIIIVALVGLVTALAVPGLGRFMEKGKTEARKVEYHNVASAIVAMMQDNNLTAIPNPVSAPGNAANDMSAFPDTTSNWSTPGGKTKDPDKTHYAEGDVAGYLLYGHDRTGDGEVGPPIHYVSMQTARYYYTCDADGTVHQYDKPGGTEYEN